MTTNLHQLFATDAAAETEGVWIPVCEGIEVKIARMGNEKFQKAYRRLCKPHRNLIRQGLLDSATEKRLLKEALAEGVLLDWRGLKQDGAPLAYSREAALKLLTELKDFADFVADEARRLDNFRERDLEDAEKN